MILVFSDSRTESYVLVDGGGGAGGRGGGAGVFLSDMFSPIVDGSKPKDATFARDAVAAGPNVKMTGPPPFAAKPPPAGVGPCRLKCYPGRRENHLPK